jgi:hypothetical protein
MPTIAIITKNKCVFEMEEFISPLLYRVTTKEERTTLKNKLNDYIWSVIEKYITFVNVDDSNDFFEKMYGVTMIDFPGKDQYDFIFNTEGSYSTPKKFLELINIRPTWKDYDDSTKNINVMNDIGCLLSLCHTVIENTCFVMANEYDLTAHRYVKMTSILKEDIIRVIRRRYFHSAILIKENLIVKYYFQNSEYLISSIFGSDEDKTIEMFPFAHFNYNLVFNFKKHATQYVNQIATRMNGYHRMYGDVLVFHEFDKDVFVNLSLREFKRLNVLSYGCLADRKLNNNEVHHVPTLIVDEKGKETTEAVPFWSKYLVIENRLSLWQKNKNKCTYCDSQCMITCDRCYRARYCSVDCKNKFINQHESECIH